MGFSVFVDLSVSCLFPLFVLRLSVRPTVIAVGSIAGWFARCRHNDPPPKVHPAFGISWYVSGCDAAGHGFKPQW